MIKSTIVSQAVLVAALAFSACEITKDDNFVKTKLLFLLSGTGITDKALGIRETYTADGLS